MNPETQAHCETIRCCNQRGGRMLSIVDLVETETLSRDLAAYALTTIGAGASFIDAIMQSGARTIEQLRTAVVNINPIPQSP